jgi:hypothetical protein
MYAERINSSEVRCIFYINELNTYHQKDNPHCLFSLQINKMFYGS